MKFREMEHRFDIFSPRAIRKRWRVGKIPKEPPKEVSDKDAKEFGNPEGTGEEDFLRRRESVLSFVNKYVKGEYDDVHLKHVSLEEHDHIQKVYSKCLEELDLIDYSTTKRAEKIHSKYLNQLQCIKETCEDLKRRKTPEEIQDEYTLLVQNAEKKEEKDLKQISEERISKSLVALIKCKEEIEEILVKVIPLEKPVAKKSYLEKIDDFYESLDVVLKNLDQEMRKYLAGAFVFAFLARHMERIEDWCLYFYNSFCDMFFN